MFLLLRDMRNVSGAWSRRRVKGAVGGAKRVPLIRRAPCYNGSSIEQDFCVVVVCRGVVCMHKHAKVL